jgi:hypothetical protein
MDPMKYKHKFYFLILVAIIYNIIQMVSYHDSKKNSPEPAVERNPIAVQVDCESICLRSPNPRILKYYPKNLPLFPLT